METQRIKIPEGYRLAVRPSDRANRDALIYDPVATLWFPTGGLDLTVEDSDYGKDPVIVIPYDADAKLENVHRMYRRRRNLLLFLAVVLLPFFFRIGWALCAYLLR